MTREEKLADLGRQGREAIAAYEKAIAEHAKTKAEADGLRRTLAQQGIEVPRIR